MVQKENLHLGQNVYYGEKRELATIDALTQTGLGLCIGECRYIIAGYGDIFTE